MCNEYTEHVSGDHCELSWTKNEAEREVRKVQGSSRGGARTADVITTAGFAIVVIHILKVEQKGRAEIVKVSEMRYVLDVRIMLHKVRQLQENVSMSDVIPSHELA